MATTLTRAPRNRTLILDEDDRRRLRPRLSRIAKKARLPQLLDRTIFGDALEVLPFLPHECVDLLIVDPPYNLTKSFNGKTFNKRADTDYGDWLRAWLEPAKRTLKATASIYVCSDWRSSGVVQEVLEDLFVLRNRITWEREKGRGALSNWKNASEDIWFCTQSADYLFNVDAVKLRRKVLAPYRDAAGRPKDWQVEGEGAFRSTHPSNLWTDISVPFWSMPENTDHPTQKPEKLIAKLILASSIPGDLVLDPFLGSGTTSVVAKKLGRHFIGIEAEEEYCLLAERRLELAAEDKSIQGYSNGCFWERNSLADQKRKADAPTQQLNIELPLVLGRRERTK